MGVTEPMGLTGRMQMTDTRSAAEISRAASEKFIEENTAITSLQRSLNSARAELLLAQSVIREERLSPISMPGLMACHIDHRHRAADRVWDLQSMTVASF